MEIKFCHGRRHVDRKGQWMHDDTSTSEANMVEMDDMDDSPEEAYFRKTVFYYLINNVVTGLLYVLILLTSWRKILILIEISHNV